MKTTITALDFNEAMTTFKCGFSYEGGTALFEYLEELEADCDIDIELDPVALRCEFTEYEDLDEIKDSYPDIETIDDLYDNTTVITFDGGIIIADF